MGFQCTEGRTLKYIFLRCKDLPHQVSLNEWPKQNFSSQYQYNIKQTSDKNKEKYQQGDYQLIQNQILRTNII